jgi:uncharacterized membrane protein
MLTAYDSRPLTPSLQTFETLGLLCDSSNAFDFAFALAFALTFAFDFTLAFTLAFALASAVTASDFASAGGVCKHCSRRTSTIKTIV